MDRRNQSAIDRKHRPFVDEGNPASARDRITTDPHAVHRCTITRRRAYTSFFVLCNRPQKVLDHVLLSVIVLLAHMGSGTNNLTIAAANTTSTTAMSPQVTVINITAIDTQKPTNNTTTATPKFTAFTDASNVPRPVHCNFSQNCDSDYVYYWMSINVDVNGSESNESNISAWLENLFQNQSECSLTASSVTPQKINPTSYSGSRNSTSINSSVSSSTPITAAIFQNDSSVTSLFYTGTLGNNSVLNGSETTMNIFKDVTVMCANKTAIRQTTCTVLLQLSQPINSCCIIQTLSTEQNKSSIQAYVIGNNVQQMVKGICRSSAAGPLVGSFEKCNGSLSPDIFCNSNATVSVSCNGNSETAYVSLAIPDQINCTFDNQPNICNCSSYCNSSAAFYSLDTKTADFNLNMTQILTNSTCDITNHGCQALKNISQIYENYTVMCDISYMQRCTIVVKLRKAIDVCLLSSALLCAFQNQSTNVTDGTVTRVAICSWKDNQNADLMQPNILPVSDLLVDVCPVGKIEISSNYCKKGTNIAVPLLEKCKQNPVNFSTTSMPSLTSKTNDRNITTIASDTNTSADTMDTTASTDSSASAEATAEDLLNMSKNASSLNATQIQQVVSRIESLLSGSNVSLALGNTSINIVSNLLDAPSNLLAPSSNRIMGIVDTVGLKLDVQGQSQSILSPSLALAVKLVNGALFSETTFTVTNPSSIQIGSRLRRAEHSSPQGFITLPASLTENLTPQQQQQASRVQFNFYQKTTLFQDKALNSLISGVLSCSVANMSISNLSDPILFTLKNIETVKQNCSRSCVFWKFNLNDGSGVWSSDGCTLLNYTETETICSCNHLTNFGVLLDFSGEGINDRLQATILTYITYIGCGISAIFLSVTLMTYLAFETLRKDIPSKIVIQLCLALFLLNLTFLLDAWLALYPKVMGLCISTAFFLHYFLLASFTWMAMEAVHMYIALVKVFNTYVSRFMLKLGLAGWGIPLIVVIIIIAIDKNNYGLVSYGKFEDATSDQFCWLKNDVAYYVGVVAYFCFIFILNLSMFIVVMVQLCRIKRQNPHNLQHRSVLQDLRSMAGLTVLLGLTWGFAFFAWGTVNLPFMYLFSIFNSLQGFFIFVFHCAAKENVRRQWRLHLCCANMRLAETSVVVSQNLYTIDWSHTATQRTKKSSVNRVTSSTMSAKSSKSNNSSSSFLVRDSSGSDRSIGIGSPLDDYAIMEEEAPSSDVVLNEINHRYRSQRFL